MNSDPQNAQVPATQIPTVYDTQHPSLGVVPQSVTSASVTQAFEANERDLTCQDRSTGTLTPAALFPATLARYQILEVIAEGGMGVVYKAWDPILNRPVALKTIRTGIRLNQQNLARFAREARAVAQLHHPHIVPIYDIEECDGQPYFTMAYAPLGSLSRQLARYQADPRAAVLLIEKVAQAIHHAHGKNILHRDLKPSNVLLKEDNEPLVSDFGLAKFLGEELELTRTGEQVGTPAYMAPEQAAGRNDRVGPATDLWALGVMLYELLAGQRPFLAADRQELTQKILVAEPVPPSVVRPELDPALDGIVLRCLAKDPQQRYGSAEDLAQALRSWLAGEFTPTHPQHRPVAFSAWWTWPRRHPRWSLAAGLLIVLLAVLPWLLPESEADPRLQPLHQALQDGSPLDFLDGQGRLHYHRWALGEAAFVKHTSKVDFITFHTATVSLLELLPDPHCERYRFQAEIRHEVNDGGDVGLYVGHSRHQVQEDTQHYFVVLSYADRGAQHTTAPGQPPAPGQVEMRLKCVSEFYPLKGFHYSSRLFPRKTFEPSEQAGEKAQWRKLAVEVTPEKLVAFWADQPTDKPEVTRQDLDSCSDQVRAVRPNLTSAAKYRPREGLGLYLNRGVASFRNVQIVPLPREK